MAGTGPQQTETTGQPKQGLLARCRERYPWFDHLARAATAYNTNNGDHYAAAITYFSVLSLVPILMIAFSVVAIVLAGNQELLAQLQEQIRTAAPPGLGDTFNQVVDEAIASRNSVGILGLLVALYSGLGWISNLREALTAQWEQRHEQQSNFLHTKAFDLLALLSLGAALLVSFGLTGIGTAFTGVLLRWLNLQDQPGARVVFSLIALVLSLAGMWLVFLWVIARLPREPVTWRSAMRAAVMGAVGFEVLKQVFAIYLNSVSGSPTGRLFGPVIGLMVFAYFVARFLLFITAWAATARENAPQPVPQPAAPRAAPA